VASSWPEPGVRIARRGILAETTTEAAVDVSAAVVPGSATSVMVEPRSETDR
jgi:hypothetical protein